MTIRIQTDGGTTECWGHTMAAAVRDAAASEGLTMTRPFTPERLCDAFAARWGAAGGWARVWYGRDVLAETSNAA